MFQAHLRHMLRSRAMACFTGDARNQSFGMKLTIRACGRGMASKAQRRLVWGHAPTERRLDAVVYRMKFVPTVFAARQFVNHGHVRVNGKRVNIGSYLVKDGDAIEVKDKSKLLALVLESVKSSERDVPDYLQVDHDKMKGTFVRAPKLADVPYPVSMEPNLVVEFYSR